MRRFDPPPARFFPVVPGKPFVRSGLRVYAFRLAHTVPSVGYVLRRGAAAAAVLGDTGYREALFRRLAGIGGLRLLVIECSYPSRLEGLAGKALHLTPALLARGLAAVRAAHPRLRVLASHLKPPWAAETERELSALDPPVRIARDGDRLPLF